MPGVNVVTIMRKLKGVGQKEREEDAKEGWSKHAALLNLAVNSKRLGCVAINTNNAPLISVWNDFRSGAIAQRVYTIHVRLPSRLSGVRFPLG